MRPFFKGLGEGRGLGGERWCVWLASWREGELKLSQTLLCQICKAKKDLKRTSVRKFQT